MARKTILIIQGHPDPSGQRLCHALTQAYAAGAREAGHGVIEVDVARLDFPLLRTQNEFMNAPMPSALTEAKEALIAADHVVIVFPLWLGTMPALLKGFLEQVMRPGVAFAYQENGFAKKLLKGRSARVVVTMAMPSLFYRLFFFANGVSVLERNILSFVGFGPVRDTLFGMAAGAEKAKVEKWLRKMRALGSGAS